MTVPVRVVAHANVVPSVPSAFRGWQLNVVLSWQPDSPDEVQMLLGEVPWSIGRDLLAAGLTGPAGMGDVFVCPTAPGRHEIVLDPGRGRAAVQIRTRDLAGFLELVERQRATDGATS